MGGVKKARVRVKTHRQVRKQQREVEGVWMAFLRTERDKFNLECNEQKAFE